MIRHIILGICFLIVFSSCTSVNQEKVNESTTSSSKLIPDSAVSNIAEPTTDVNIFSEIGTPSKYIWEALNESAKTYTTLAFDDGTFRLSAFSINGSVNNLTNVMNINGIWQSVGNNQINGIISINGVAVSWTVSDDFTSLTNNKGVVFTRVNMNKKNDQPAITQQETSPDGRYTYHDNSVDIQINISGDSWTGKTKIISGLGDEYDNENIEYESGVVRGSALYDPSGFAEIGKVDGTNLRTTIGGNSITLRKK
jgi:hypothetical protein